MKGLVIEDGSQGKNFIFLTQDELRIILATARDAFLKDKASMVESPRMAKMSQELIDVLFPKAG